MGWVSEILVRDPGKTSPGSRGRKRLPNPRNWSWMLILHQSFSATLRISFLKRVSERIFRNRKCIQLFIEAMKNFILNFFIKMQPKIVRTTSARTESTALNPTMFKRNIDLKSQSLSREPRKEKTNALQVPPPR
jgi:hypothetical protein